LSLYLKEKYMIIHDTIAAISTPQGTGGLGIIRISGDKAFYIASKIFEGSKNFKEIKSHTLNYGKIINPETGETIDEVLVAKMKKPRTYTREDVVEINCHGGIVVIKKILELVVKEGARLAEPGEFTKLAFLNGRIDLSQAEAVIDLINSKTEQGSKAALDQLEGRLSKKLKQVRDKLIGLIAHIEVTVDYPEHDIEEITGKQVYEDLKLIKGSLSDIIKNFEKGRILREGITVVIVGKPNVGKSSLLNELSGKKKAIVTDIPGTTRDIIEEYVNMGGIPVRLIDTAGIRETEDVVEKIGVERARKAVESADLVVMMFDTESQLTSEDIDIFNTVKDKKIIVLINKIDKESESENITRIENRFKGYKIIKTSVTSGTGIEQLENEIIGLFNKGEVGLNNEILVTNVRHKNLIDKSMKSIDAALSSYENAMPLDCITIDIKDAAEYLGQITGESASDDVLHHIFSRFCIGK
jgi:tRNA modification GTPase